MRAVIDTNVLVSGLAYPDGTPGRILAAWDAHAFGLVLAHAQLHEIARVLAYPKVRRLLRWEDERIEAFVRQLLLRTEVVDVKTTQVDVPGDPDDVPILAALVANGADVLVSGDADLLALRDRYPIETPAEFARRL